MDFDGIADRVVHYCEDNSIDYQSSLAFSEFKDQDGIDDSKLIQALSAAPANPTITPAVSIPGDAVTASGSGLDPHISPRNAELQKKRIATARGITPEQVQKLIDEHTDRPWVGLLGDPGVNVLLLNLALDAKYPDPARRTSGAPQRSRQLPGDGSVDRTPQRIRTLRQFGAPPVALMKSPT